PSHPGTNRLDLARTRLDFVTKLGEIDTAVSDDNVDAAEQTQALQDSIPELTTPGAPTTVVTAPPSAALSSSGTRTLIYRLLAVQRGRRAAIELAQATGNLARVTRAELQETQQA